jgi:hypothetical protein
VSSEGFLIRFLLAMTATIAAVWLAVACAASRPQGAVLGAGQERGSWATPTELAWLKKLGAWDVRVLRGLRGGGMTPAAPASLRRCEGDLLTKVGPPPTARLRPAFETFRSACRSLRRADAVGARLLLQADQTLPPGEVRQLPVIGGVSAQSRLEPRFGRIASSLAGKQVEVRCWSTADWMHLIREERTYTHGQLGSDTLAFAGIGGNRVNLGPDVCSTLVSLAYRGTRPSDEAGRFLAASAVVTLSHEPQHSKGIAAEATAECNAIQLAHRTAMRLGASRAYAESLVRTYWRHYAEELPAYRSPECRKGAALDLGYADSIWP